MNTISASVWNYRTTIFKGLVAADGVARMGGWKEPLWVTAGIVFLATVMGVDYTVRTYQARRLARRVMAGK